MCLGVAALLAFTQQNVTGPVNAFSPFPLPFPGLQGVVNGGKWDAWARAELTSAGCPVLGKFSLLQYILYAKILFGEAKGIVEEWRETGRNDCRTVSWWCCRADFLHQRILDDLSSSLYDELQVLVNDTLLQFGKSEDVIDYWGSRLCEDEGSIIASMAHLEAGLVQYKYGWVDSSRAHNARAEDLSGMHLFVTGVLGFRTTHQVDAKAQMVLVADTDSERVQNGGLAKSFPSENDSSSENNSNLKLDGDCDILLRPRLVEDKKFSDHNEIMPLSETVALSAVQQAIILAQGLHLKRRSREDELSRWEMAPYIEAVDGQQKSFFIIRSFCSYLRMQWECTRSRTEQRALLMTDKLVNDAYADFPAVANRIQFSYGVYMPTIPALRKEFGMLLVSCGMVGEALRIFEDLELWDSLIYCYCSLGKKSAAVDIIKARLNDMPNDPKLWCALGSVTKTDAYYEKALEVSNGRSSEAKRALAKSAYERGDFQTSKILWEAAMALNSLYPDGWFNLGCAALKARDNEKALDGFTRAVQLEPEKGEAWNNIAYLHLIKKRNREAFVAFKEALKYRRNSWQLWENYSHVAYDVGNFSQALEAIKMVLELSTTAKIDIDLLEKIMQRIEEAYSITSHDDPPSLDTILQNPREKELLIDQLGSTLQKVIKRGRDNDVWCVYARWHKFKGNLALSAEALLKQVRSYQGSDLWYDHERFKKFAYSSLQLCKVYMEIASTTGSRSELKVAEMHLQSSINKTVDFFPGTPELHHLQLCLDEIKKQLDQ